MPPNYGQQIQHVKQSESALLLNGQQTKFIHEVKRTFLYYVRVVDSKMLMALSTITMKQTALMTKTMKNTKKVSGLSCYKQQSDNHTPCK